MHHNVFVRMSICALLAIFLSISGVAMAVPALRPVTVGTQIIADAPYLRNVLPQATFAYVRIPNLWGVLGSPSGNIFTQLLQSAAHQEAILTIRSGILERFVPEIPREWQGLSEFLLTQTRSPVEFAVIPTESDKQGNPNLSELLLTVTLEQSSIETANTALNSLIAKVPGLTIPEPLQTDGSGRLSVAGVPLDLYFDVAQRRLFLGMALLNPQAPPLKQRVTSLKLNPQHPMHKVESGLDNSGQGFLMWLDPAPMLQAAESLGKVSEVAMLRASGIAEARSISIGMGSSGGKQRLKMAIEMPQVGLRNILPAIHTNLPFVSAANLDTVLMLGLPTTEDLARLETSIKPFMSNEDNVAYNAEKSTVQEWIGITVEQLLDTFRGESLVLHDEAGYYMAIGLHNPATYETMLKYLIPKYKLKYETRELLGTTFHHLSVPSSIEIEQTLATVPTPPGELQVPGLLEHVLNQGTNIYWIERHGYLIFADVPQILMDFLYSTPGVDVAAWLRESQGIDPSGALLLASTRTTGVPQLIYQIHLWLLDYLGGVTGHPVDLFTLPSVRELNLPAGGGYSLQFTSAPDQLALELVYESNPLEGVLSMGGMATLMTAGVVAAVAIPAYFTETPDVATTVEIAPATVEAIVTARNQVAEFYTVLGRFPAVGDMDKLALNRPVIENAEFTLAPESGIITIKFATILESDGDVLTLTPIVGPTGITWECGGSLKAESRPEALCLP